MNLIFSSSNRNQNGKKGNSNSINKLKSNSNSHSITKQLDFSINKINDKYRDKDSDNDYLIQNHSSFTDICYLGNKRICNEIYYDTNKDFAINDNNKIDNIVSSLTNIIVEIKENQTNKLIPERIKDECIIDMEELVDNQIKPTSNVNSYSSNILRVNSDMYKTKDYINNLEIFSIHNNNNFSITNEPTFSSKNNIILDDYQIERMSNKNILDKFLCSQQKIKGSYKNINQEFEKFDSKYNNPISMNLNMSMTLNNQTNTNTNLSNGLLHKSSSSSKDLSLLNYFNKIPSTISLSNSNHINKKIQMQNQVNESNESLVTSLNTVITDLKREIKELKTSNEKSKAIISEQEEKINQFKNNISELNSKLNSTRNVLVNILRREEANRKQKQKEWINLMMYKLGKGEKQSNINTSQLYSYDLWDDGEDILNAKNELLQIHQERDKLDNQNKDLIKKINSQKKSNQSTLQSTKELVYNTQGNNSYTNLNTDNERTNDIDLLQERAILLYKYENISRKEMKAREKLDELYKLKVNFRCEYKRIIEEEKCRFSNNQNSIGEKWPLLQNRYLLLSLLGKGGYSEVYRSYDIFDFREVAIKIHQLNYGWNETLKKAYIKHTIRENTIHENVSHKNIISHYDTLGIDKNCFCTIMELCSGPDLGTYLKLNKTLLEKEAKLIMTQILNGLMYLHIEKKIIHYDLKPQNILFHDNEIKITDFGLSKVLNSQEECIELTSQGVGTYWYLPPECFQNGDVMINPKVDIWSVGVIFYECLYGKRPFAHTMSQERIIKEGVILNARKVDFPDTPLVSIECKEFIKKCLEYNVEKRYSTREAFYCDYIRRKN